MCVVASDVLRVSGFTTPSLLLLFDASSVKGGGHRPKNPLTTETLVYSTFFFSFIAAMVCIVYRHRRAGGVLEGI